jgi:hypothetical protein
MKIGARVRTAIRGNDGYGYVPGARQRYEALMMTVKSNGHANPQAPRLFTHGSVHPPSAIAAPIQVVRPFNLLLVHDGRPQSRRTKHFNSPEAAENRIAKFTSIGQVYTNTAANHQQ